MTIEKHETTEGFPSTNEALKKLKSGILKYGPLKTVERGPKGSEKDVKNQSFKQGGEVGVYSGKWVSTPDNGYPSGDGRFESNDSVYVGKFDQKGFKKGTIENKKEREKFNVTRMANGDMKGYAEIAGVRYDGIWDRNMKLKECTYKGIKLKLKNNTFINDNGDSLPLDKKHYNIGLVGARIAKAISIVKYSGYRLDQFEADSPITLQADYDNKTFDVDLFRDTMRTLGINAHRLANRLNKSRSEWGI